MTPMSEPEYRAQIQKVLDAVEKAFDSIDPDVAEAEQQFGALTIRLTGSGGQKCILSAQPSVRQLWIAAASKGIAHHFNYDLARGGWWDDKGKGVEAVAFVRELVREAVGIDLKI